MTTSTAYSMRPLVAAVIAAVVLLVACVQAEDIPVWLQPCSRSDPQINVCIKNSFNHLRPYLARGIPELGVPALEPLIIDQMAMENDAGAVRIKALFSGISVKGAGNFSVKEVRSDLSKLRIDMRISVPRVEARGKYDVSGNVLLLPVRSNGDFWAEFSDVSSIAKIYGKSVERNGIMYMDIDKMSVDFTMKNARFKVKDNVNTQNVLGEAINQFLNNNANELVQEMRPAASASIAKLFRNLLNKAIAQIPVGQWLLD